MLNEVVCPECKGAQQLFDHACGCHLAHRGCPLCKGAGHVSSDAAERWRMVRTSREESSGVEHAQPQSEEDASLEAAEARLCAIEGAWN